MSFVSTDPQNHQSENTWFTPIHIIDALGPFDLDPCSVSYRPFDTAREHIEHDRGACGLSAKWFGDVWLNPPYGKEIKPFIDKFIDHKKGVMLIFARMDSQPIQDLIKAGASFYFLRKRIKFIRKDGATDSNAGTGSCLVYFDNKYNEICKNIPGAGLC